MKQQENVRYIVRYLTEASRGAGAQSVTAKLTGCGVDLEEMKYILKFIFLFRRSGVEAKHGVELCHSTMPPEFGRIPAILLCAGYSVKLKKLI